MTESSTEDAAQGAWIAGWLDGILTSSEAPTERANVAPADADPAYLSGYRQGDLAGRRADAVRIRDEGQAIRPTRRIAVRRLARAAIRAARSVAVVLATFGTLVLVEHATTGLRAPAVTPVVVDERAADEDLFLTVLGGSDEMARLAALRILLERAEQGRLASVRRAPLENLVQECASPDVALAAASVVKSLS